MTNQQKGRKAKHSWEKHPIHSSTGFSLWSSPFHRPLTVSPRIHLYQPFPPPFNLCGVMWKCGQQSEETEARCMEYSLCRLWRTKVGLKLFQETKVNVLDLGNPGDPGDIGDHGDPGDPTFTPKIRPKNLRPLYQSLPKNIWYFLRLASKLETRDTMKLLSNKGWWTYLDMNVGCAYVILECFPTGSFVVKIQGIRSMSTTFRPDGRADELRQQTVQRINKHHK